MGWKHSGGKHFRRANQQTTFKKILRNSSETIYRGGVEFYALWCLRFLARDSHVISVVKCLSINAFLMWSHRASHDIVYYVKQLCKQVAYNRGGEEVWLRMTKQPAVVEGGGGLLIMHRQPLSQSVNNLNRLLNPGEWKPPPRGQILCNLNILTEIEITIGMMISYTNN